LARSLTANLNVDAEQTELLRKLQATITGEGADLVRGEALFTKHCSNCHQLRGQGLVVGPQLDGAASRSIQRLLEDIITPDRNVDHAFRTTIFLLDDGRVVSGLITSESDTEVIVVEPTGKPITLGAAMIEQRREAGRSLMPGNMGEVLAAEELRDLIHFVKGR
jgi:putative heme-binding domain-containing protein